MQVHLENYCKNEGTLQHEELQVNGEVLLQKDCLNGEKVMYTNLSSNNILAPGTAQSSSYIGPLQLLKVCIIIIPSLQVGKLTVR